MSTSTLDTTPMGLPNQRSKDHGARTRARRTAIAVRVVKKSASDTTTVPSTVLNSTPYPTCTTTLSSSSSSSSTSTPSTHSAHEMDSDFSAYSDASADPETLSDTDGEMAAGKELGISSYEELGAALDPEAEEIMGDIARFREEGPTRPRHTPRTTELWKTESEFWAKFCCKIRKRTGLGAEELLRKCDPAIFKSYLFWRKKESRIKKESTIEAYWKRISMYYQDITGYAIGNEVLKDVRNWLPSLGLDRSKKEKLAMYVQTLYAIIHALWVDDTKPLPGFIRIQISLLLLLSAATATRPGALVESASNKGSNKALCFKNVELMKVRCIGDPTKSTIIVNVNLEHVKNKEKGGTPKKFTFRLEGLPALCIVLHVLGIAQGRNAFRNNITSVQQIFDLVIPAERNVLRIRWKKEMLDKPFFCDFDHTVDGGRIQEDRAFPYAKYRDGFIRLGLVLGIEEPLELYEIRRASGQNINSAATSVERNQTMGHDGATYERYYTPTHIARDFQAIYFGTPPEEELIRSVASMGLSRDRRAPIDLNDTQQKEVRNDPLLASLREERETYKQELKVQGFYPLSTAKGTDLHNRYERTNKEIASTYQQLYRLRLKQVIREFHDSIDTIEIAKQLNGKTAVEVLTLPPAEFELRERATIAAMLFKPIRKEKTRMKFVHTLACLFPLRETRRPKATKRAAAESGFESYDVPAMKRRRSAGTLEKYISQPIKQEPDQSECEDVVEIEPRHLYPNVPPYSVCGFCYGNKQVSHSQRSKHWPRKDVLNKHVDIHLRNTEYQNEFKCPYPDCHSVVHGAMHFKRHSLDVHEVAH